MSSISSYTSQPNHELYYLFPREIWHEILNKATLKTNHVFAQTCKEAYILAHTKQYFKRCCIIKIASAQLERENVDETTGRVLGSILRVMAQLGWSYDLAEYLKMFLQNNQADTSCHGHSSLLKGLGKEIWSEPSLRDFLEFIISKCPEFRSSQLQEVCEEYQNILCIWSSAREQKYDIARAIALSITNFDLQKEALDLINQCKTLTFPSKQLSEQIERCQEQSQKKNDLPQVEDGPCITASLEKRMKRALVAHEIENSEALLQEMSQHNPQLTIELICIVIERLMKTDRYVHATNVLTNAFKDVSNIFHARLLIDVILLHFTIVDSKCK